MQTVNFTNVLCCDVRVNEFEGKDYYSVIVYSDGRVYRISLPDSFIHAFDKFIGSYVSFVADIRIYDGKAKYKYEGSEIIKK